MRILIYNCCGILFFIFLLLTADGVSAQNRLAKNIRQYKAPDSQAKIAEPGVNSLSSPVVVPLPDKPSSGNSVTVIGLGTSANGLGWGAEGSNGIHSQIQPSILPVSIPLLIIILQMGSLSARPIMPIRSTWIMMQQPELTTTS